MGKKKWISGAIKHPGALTKKAAAKKETVSEYVAHPPKKVSGTTKKQINLAKTLKKIGKKGK